MDDAVLVQALQGHGGAMPDLTPNIGAFASIAKEDLARVFQVLQEMGYTLLGPTRGETAIVYDEI